MSIVLFNLAVTAKHSRRNPISGFPCLSNNATSRSTVAFMNARSRVSYGMDISKAVTTKLKAPTGLIFSMTIVHG